MNDRSHAERARAVADYLRNRNASFDHDSWDEARDDAAAVAEYLERRKDVASDIRATVEKLLYRAGSREDDDARFMVRMAVACDRHVADLGYYPGGGHLGTTGRSPIADPICAHCSHRASMHRVPMACDGFMSIGSVPGGRMKHGSGKKLGRVVFIWWGWERGFMWPVFARGRWGPSSKPDWWMFTFWLIGPVEIRVFRKDEPWKQSA